MNRMRLLPGPRRGRARFPGESPVQRPPGRRGGAERRAEGLAGRLSGGAACSAAGGLTPLHCNHRAPLRRGFLRFKGVFRNPITCVQNQTRSRAGRTEDR
jgi:hypothetical protein